MIVVILEEIERLIFEVAQKASSRGKPLSLRLSATIKEDEGLVRVHSAASSGSKQSHLMPGDAEVRGWISPSAGGVDVGGTKSQASSRTAAFPCLIFLANPGADIQCHWMSSADAIPEPSQLEVIRLSTDLSLRTKGILESTALASKRVAIIGLGSGGSLGAIDLAKCGVGHFTLVDFDRLKAHNVSRHACGLKDVGRFKTLAVRDAILERNPLAQVDCHDVDICKELEMLRQIVEGSDLIFAATDTELSKYLINETCLAVGKPAIYGGAYERAFAGEIIRVIPGETGCYACFRMGMAESMPSADDQTVDYTVVDDSDLRAEPGLGVDIGAIALLQVKMALLTLLRGTGSSLEDIDADMIIWVNYARQGEGMLYQRPLARHFVKVPPSEDCPACGSGEYLTG